MSSPRSPRSASSGSPRRALHLDNFEKSGRLNSPRSLEVCRRFGIDPSELLPRTPESFNIAASPNRPGASQVLVEALAQRRYDHFEQKRQQKLAFLRQEREQLIMQPDFGENSPSKSENSGAPMTPRTASRISQQAQQLQKSNFALLQARRKEWALLKAERLAETLAVAEQLKQQHLAAIADDSHRHWEQVAATTEHSKRLNESRSTETKVKHLEKSYKRDVKCLVVASERDAKAREKHMDNEMRIRQARDRNAQVTAQVQEKRTRKWQDVEAEADACRVRHELAMDELKAFNARHFDYVAQVHDGTRLSEEMSTALKQQRLAEKSLLEQRVLEAQQQREALRIEMERMQSESHRQEVRQQGQEILSATVSQKDQAAQLKHSKFDESKGRLIESQVWNSELRREGVTDHAEEVRRTRRSQEYQRKQHMETLVQRSYSRPVSPRPGSS